MSPSVSNHRFKHFQLILNVCDKVFFLFCKITELLGMSRRHLKYSPIDILWMSLLWIGGNLSSFDFHENEASRIIKWRVVLPSLLSASRR